MGDRGSICVVDQGSDPAPARVYLYTQSAGRFLPKCLQQALNSLAPFTPYYNQPDVQKLSHRVYVEMLELERGRPLRDRGFGISGSLSDNEHPVLTVYVNEMTVALHDVRDEPTGRSWTFDEFRALTLAEDPWKAVATGHEPGQPRRERDKPPSSTVPGSVILEAIRALPNPTAQEVAMELRRRGISVNERAIRLLADRLGLSTNIGADGEKHYNAPVG